ncbi:MAG TPA: hypothetical protein VFT48_11660 [Pyrinomonadaceae bacterium]|nr:hypothetical protein [Pyrinomonadaceae bacterium]
MRDSEKKFKIWTSAAKLLTKNGEGRILKPVYRAMLVILMLVACGCSNKPRTVEKYAKDGISFSHYSTWRVTEDAPIEGTPDSRSITIDGPNHAIVMFIFLPPGDDVTVENFAAGVASGRLEEIENMSIGSVRPADITDTKTEPITGRVGGRVQKGLVQRFSIKILGQLVPHVARIFSVENDHVKVFIVTQINTEDLRDTTPDFDLILDSVSLASGK